MNESILTIISGLTPDIKAALETYADEAHHLTASSHNASRLYLEGYLRGAYAHGGILTDHLDRLLNLIRDLDGHRIIAACFTGE